MDDERITLASVNARMLAIRYLHDHGHLHGRGGGGAIRTLPVSVLEEAG